MRIPRHLKIHDELIDTILKIVQEQRLAKIVITNDVIDVRDELDTKWVYPVVVGQHISVEPLALTAIDCRSVDKDAVDDAVIAEVVGKARTSPTRIALLGESINDPEAILKAFAVLYKRESDEPNSIRVLGLEGIETLIKAHLKLGLDRDDASADHEKDC